MPGTWHRSHRLQQMKEVTPSDLQTAASSEALAAVRRLLRHSWELLLTLRPGNLATLYKPSKWPPSCQWPAAGQGTFSPILYGFIRATVSIQWQP